jgi:DNA-directed RNA polymerase specialized sigma24 family protein
LKSLRPEHRQVILLTRIHGLSVHEAAKNLGKTEKATSLLLWRAMAKLKEAMDATDSFSLPQRDLAKELDEERDRDAD